MNHSILHHRRLKHQGFSMLELMIVLVLMVGILAIAWPSLQRPFRQASLQTAAQQLREAIDDSRSQAITSGHPVFLELKEGNGEFRTGCFESFQSDDSVDTGTSSGLEASEKAIAELSYTSNTSTTHARTFKLPSHVKIAKVRWALESPSDDSLMELAATETEANILALGTEGKETESLASSDSEAALESLGVQEEACWLPITAVGKGRDIFIELYDESIDRSLTVCFASATGALEILR